MLQVKVGSARKLVLSVVLATAALLAVFLWAEVVDAAPAAQADEVISGPVLLGDLAAGGTRHYLQVEPLQRDGFIVLTLSFEPLNTDLQGLVNFLVLDEDQLRRFIAGDLDIREENVASGALLQFDPAGNKMRASFKDSGRGEYAVLVYNNAGEPISYKLEAIGGVLSDALDQTTLPPDEVEETTDGGTGDSAGNSAASQADTQVGSGTESTTTSGAAVTSIASPFGEVNVPTVSGELAPPINRHYLKIDPTVRDGTIDLKMTYAPDSEVLRESVNFMVLDEDGVRRFIRGDDVFELELATGAPIPFNDFENELGARFRASGDGPYTAVLYNSTAEPATYIFEARGATLIDLYGQTNESKSASGDGEAVTPVATPTPLPANSASATADGANIVLVSNEGAALADSSRATVLTGLLDQPYEHHYFGLFPEIRDGRVNITLDYDPRDSDVLRGNVNFWVLDADGLRRVIAGARPQDEEIASGAVVPFGIDKGKLRAIFDASARGEYTIIVYNNTEEAALYSLQVAGGVLEDLSAQAQALGTLP